MAKFAISAELFSVSPKEGEKVSDLVKRTEKAMFEEYPNISGYLIVILVKATKGIVALVVEEDPYLEFESREEALEYIRAGKAHRPFYTDGGLDVVELAEV